MSNKSVVYQSKDIFYTVSGSGPTLMLVHGFAEDGQIWDEQLRYLENNFTVVIPDLPGSGLSEYNPDLQTIEDFAGIIRLIAEAEKIDRFTLIGHSMGGYISLAFAEQFPKNLIGLGLFHSTAYADSAEKIKTRRSVISTIQKDGARRYIKEADPLPFSPHTRKEHPEKIEQIIDRYANFDGRSLVSYQEAMIRRPDRTAVLKHSGLPILFVIGEDDPVIPLNDSLQQSYLPELSYIHILKNTGHMGMMEDTTYSNRIMENFLRGILH